MGELKRKYASQLIALKELFPDWTDEDGMYALRETDGDLNRTIDNITEGTYADGSAPWALVGTPGSLTRVRSGPGSGGRC